MKSITAITVVHNTPQLLHRTVTSFHKYYPKIHICIVNNGSTDGSKYEGLYPNTTLYDLRQNIGHGPALHFAMKRIDTKYAIFMDSDIEVMCGGVIEEMLKQVGAGMFYGIGEMVNTNDNGFTITNGEQNIKYLHPYFCLIDRAMYFSWHRAINHGSPMIKAMKEIHDAEMSDILLHEFPVKDYVHHDWKGTRGLNRGNGPRGWLKNWEKV